MLKAFSLFVLVLVLAAAGSVVTPAEGRPVGCASGTTVAANELVRVFRVGPRNDDHELYACWLRNKRVRLLGERATYTAEPSYVSLRALRDRWVVIDSTFVPRESGATRSLQIADVSRRRGCCRTAEISGKQIAGLTVTRRGAAVWTDREADRVRVMALTATGPQILDELPGVEFGSSTATDRRAYWMRDGQPRTAPLP
jgi:hypothetical protein